MPVLSNARPSSHHFSPIGSLHITPLSPLPRPGSLSNSPVTSILFLHSFQLLSLRAPVPIFLPPFKALNIFNSWSFPLSLFSFFTRTPPKSCSSWWSTTCTGSSREPGTSVPRRAACRTGPAPTRFPLGRSCHTMMRPLPRPLRSCAAKWRVCLFQMTEKNGFRCGSAFFAMSCT